MRQWSWECWFRSPKKAKRPKTSAVHPSYGQERRKSEQVRLERNSGGYPKDCYLCGHGVVSGVSGV